MVKRGIVRLVTEIEQSWDEFFSVDECARGRRGVYVDVMFFRGGSGRHGMFVMAYALLHECVNSGDIVR